jgi:hypothetical protein
MAEPFSQVLERLRSVGIDRSYVRSMLLPVWWNDEMAESPTGLTETLQLISSALNVTPAALRGEAPFAFANPGSCRFKLSSDRNRADVALAQHVAVRAARLVVSARKETAAAPLPDAISLRRTLLDSGRPCIDFGTLLDFCWTAGIAVLHVANFPSGGKKMTALATRIEGAPAIVLCRNEPHPSWLLFHLAHELGHHACGHLPTDGVIADEGVEGLASGADESGADGQGGAVNDADERQANDFAFELLGGRPPRRLPLVGNWKAPALAERARVLGNAAQVDAGHLALVYAMQMNRAPLGRAAINLLGPRENAIEMIRSRLIEHVDGSALSEEKRDLLGRLTGVDFE